LVNELKNYPIYKGHIKNSLYSDEIPIFNYENKDLKSGIYCWSMSDLMKCQAITDIASNPLVINLVSQYLGCLPTCYGINCMFSKEYSGHGTTTRHRDSDDFKFLSLFIYLDDVTLSNGPHAYELGTHLGNPEGNKGNELPNSAVNTKIFTGKAGEGFIEDNWGVHYGMSLPPNKSRKCLWIRYGLYNNYTSRTSVNIKKHKIRDHKFDLNSELNKYVFRFLIEE
jgi:hypothetical protein